MSQNLHCRPKYAFTLVELLVVIGVIAVLIAILLPALNKARAAARTLQCATSMREIGQAMTMFSQSHLGRFPGSGNNTNGSISWDSILNTEHYKYKSGNSSRVVIGSYVPRAFSCPELRGSVTGIRRYTMNEYASGGAISVNTPPGGKYGVEITPPDTYMSGMVFYRLGCKVSKFKEASTTFLLLESERSTAYCNSRWPHNDNYATWHLGDSLPGRPEWSGSYGAFAFRHPYGRGMNALFVDGHVERMGPGDELNLTWRFKPAGHG